MAGRTLARAVVTVGWALTLAACTIAPPKPRPTSESHLSTAPPAPAAAIPAPVKRSAFIPPPMPSPPEETFTVVVNEVPVRELLFALARDAKVNVDVDPAIAGNVTLNAIDQSLNQILERISRQLALRYETRDGTLVIQRDTAYLRTYRVDYVNVSRNAIGAIGASTAVGGAGGVGTQSFANTSSTDIKSATNAQFWETLEATLIEIVRPPSDESDDERLPVILNREGGLVIVRATGSQHEMVQRYLTEVMASSTRQVLIEATIVEVELADEYQAGIDWQVFTRGGGLTGAGLTFGTDVANAFTAGAAGAVTGLIFDGSNAPDGSTKRNFQVSISLLNQFGDVKVISSPKVMTLNNQPAILKVVDNEVYFDISSEIAPGNDNTNATVSFNTDARTVSVGLVMNVTPQVSEGDLVTLNVRPTVTRIREFVDDPAVPVALAQANITDVNIQNAIPVISVRETETVMRVGSGQLAILGGLMQDTTAQGDETVPGFAELPLVGEAFKFRNRTQAKTELVVFLRPTVIRSPDIDGDLAQFRRYLPENLQTFERQEAPFIPVPMPGGTPQ